jgi:hypothetical protein
MKTKWKWLWLLLLIPVTGVGWQLYNHYVSTPPAAKLATSVFAEAGFLTLRLTLDHHAPGSFYTVDKISGNFINLRPTCEVDTEELAKAIQTHRTTDTYGDIEQKLTAGIAVAPENWGKLGIDADLADVQHIQAVYSDSKVELLSTEKIRILQNDFLMRKSCFAAVKYELEQGYEVCQTEAVIVSDLVFKVTRGTRSGVGLDLATPAAAKISGRSTTDNSSTSKIAGNKMYHAVKLHRSKQKKSCILLKTATG